MCIDWYGKSRDMVYLVSKKEKNSTVCVYAAYNDWLLLLWSLECLVADRHSVTPLRFMYMFVSAFNWIFVSLSRTLFFLKKIKFCMAYMHAKKEELYVKIKFEKKINGWERHTNQHQFSTYTIFTKNSNLCSVRSSWKAHKIFRILIAFMPVCLLVCLHFKPFVEYHYYKNCAFTIDICCVRLQCIDMHYKRIENVCNMAATMT